MSDADAKNYYEQHKASYGTPERRELHQIVFPKPEEAAAAHERIAKGASFADIAKERGLKASDTDVGMVTKADIIDPAVADAAFALKAGEVSAPVKGRFGTVLLQVGKIEPGNQKTYEEVAPQIKREIAESRAKTEIGNLRDKFEDERAAGSTLAEAAKKLGLKSRTIDAVDRSGRGPDGKPVADLPTTPDVIAAAFASDVGVDNDPLQLPDGGYLWYDVTGITPARDRTLDEVKDKVEARWRDDEIAKRLQAKADDMVGKLKAGTHAGPARHRHRPESGDGDRSATRQTGRLRAGQAGRGGLQDAQGRAGQRRRRSGNHALRVPRDRRRRSPARSHRPQGRSRPRCRTPTPTMSSAPMSRGWKAISASRSTSRR